MVIQYLFQFNLKQENSMDLVYCINEKKVFRNKEVFWLDTYIMILLA